MIIMYITIYVDNSRDKSQLLGCVSTQTLREGSFSFRKIKKQFETLNNLKKLNELHLKCQPCDILVIATYSVTTHLGRH
jgi:hypothetical protein